MRHRTPAPPLSTRVAGALSRELAHTRPPARHSARPAGRHSARRPSGRLALALGGLCTVAGLVVVVPSVSSSSGTPAMTLDSSSSTATGLTEATEATEAIEAIEAAEITDSSTQETAARDRSAPPATTGTGTGSAPQPGEVAARTDGVAPGLPTAAPAGASPATPTLAAAAPAGGVPPGAEAAVLAAVNAARADSGCEPLVHDEGLATVARAHSADMRDRSFFHHVNPAGLDPFDRAEAAGQTNARAENIAMGQTTPAAVMEFWSDSSGHRANILDCSVRTLGVGVAEGPAGPWWTQLFGD